MSFENVPPLWFLVLTLILWGASIFIVEWIS